MGDLFQHIPEGAEEAGDEIVRAVLRPPDPRFFLTLGGRVGCHENAGRVVDAAIAAAGARVFGVEILHDGWIVADFTEIRRAAEDRGARIELVQDLELLRTEKRRRAALSTQKLLEEIREDLVRIGIRPAAAGGG